MVKKQWIAVVGGVFLISGIATAGASLAQPDDGLVRGGTIRLEKQAEADFPVLARLKFDQAVAKALDAVQGQVLKIELENENGFLVYGVEVVTAGLAIVDVKVDAGSGKVLVTDRDPADEHGHGGYRNSDGDGHDCDRGRDRDEGDR